MAYGIWHMENDTPAAQSQTLTLSHQKLKALQPELYSSRGWRKFLRENGYRLSSPDEAADHWKDYVAENLRSGDCEAAVVISDSPLLIAAYAGELDCVALLGFPGGFATKYDLKTGSRLLAVNFYLEWNFFLPEDLTPGPRQTGKYRNFAPLIAEFLTDDAEIIEHEKAEITQSEWRRAETLGEEYLKQNGEKARDGRPLLCHLPAKAAKAPAKTRKR
ncbi:MAG: hypothetical protein ACREAM_27955 [Blastocatellia bacterium]